MMTYEQVNNISCNIALGIYASIVLCAVYYLLGFGGLIIGGFFVLLFIGLCICVIKGMENKFLCFDNFDRKMAEPKDHKCLPSKQKLSQCK
jgi:hypothetical protein